MDFSVYVSEKIAVEELRAVARNKIDLYNSNLLNALDRYEGVSLTLARHPEISSLLADPKNGTLMRKISRELNSLANATGVVAIFLMGRQGTIIASAHKAIERVICATRTAYL